MGVQRSAIDDGVSRLVGHDAGLRAPRWSKSDGVALIALLALLAAALYWLVHPWYDPMIDASIYISTTRSLLAGEGYSYLGTPFHLRPPGFPVLLAPLLHAMGTDFYALNLFVASFGCGAIVLLYIWARPQIGGLLAFLVCITVGTNPVFATLCNQVMSDVPGVFFVLASLLLARRCERNPSVWNEIGLGVCIAASTYVRVLGVMVLPAILIERALRHLRNPSTSRTHSNFALQRVVPVLVATVVLLAPWGIRNHFVKSDPPADQLLNYSYATALLHYDFGDPDSPFVSARDWGARILERCNEITASLASRLQETRVTLGHVAISIVILGLFLYSQVVAASAAGLFVLFSMAVTGSYFAYQDRLLLPTFVLMLPIVVGALHRFLDSRVGPKLATGCVALLLAGICIADFSPRKGWSEIEAQYGRSVGIADALERELPSGARLATVRGFHLSMLLDQPVYSIRWGHRLGVGMAGIDAVIDRYGVNTLVFDPESRLDREYEPAFVARYGDGKVVGGVRVLRVRD